MDLYQKGSSRWSRNEDFEEDEVWSVLNNETTTDFDSNSSTAPRMIPRPRTINRRPPDLQRQSAPVNILDWSNIYGKSTTTAGNSTWLNHDGGGGGGGGKVMPPHEWVAEKLARSEISSFSVCEGAGRTLKGRDLSRVRNAVLTKTGFLE